MKIIIIIILLSTKLYCEEEIEHKCGSMEMKWAIPWGDSFVEGYRRDFLSTISSDNSGNSITIGLMFNYQTTLKDNEQDSLSPTKTNPIIRKYSPDGDLLWSTLYNPHYRTNILKSVVDSLDNIYLAGTYDSSLGGRKNLFIAKLDKNGKRLGKSIVHLSQNTRINYVVYRDSLIYISGRTTSVSGIIEEDIEQYDDGRYYGFILCYDLNLNKKWGKYIKGTFEEKYKEWKEYDAGSLAIDSRGNLYVSCYGQANFQLTHGIEKYKGTGSDAYMRKYSKEGDLIWSKIYHESKGADGIGCLTMNKDEEIIACFHVNSKRDKNIHTQGEVSKGEDNSPLIMKLNLDGEILWSQYTGNWNDYSVMIECDNESNIYIITSFRDDKSTDKDLKEADSCRVLGKKFYIGYNITKYTTDGTRIYNYKILYHSLLVKDFKLISQNNFILNGLRCDSLKFTKDTLKNYSIYGILKFGINEVSLTQKEDIEYCTGKEYKLNLQANTDAINSEIWLELSDTDGYFEQSRVISDTISQYESIDIKIPKDINGNDKYRLRINSDNDKLDYSYSNFKIKIKESPSSELSSQIDSVCLGESYQYEALDIDGIEYNWQVLGGDLLTSPSQEKVEVKWKEAEKLELVLEENKENGCSSSKTFTIYPYPKTIIEYQDTLRLCQNANKLELENISPSGGSYSGVGIVDNELDPSKLEAGKYSLTYTITEPCLITKELEYEIYKIPNKPEIKESDGLLFIDGEELYHWYKQSGNTLGGIIHTGASYRPVIDGKYLARAENENGCLSDTSSSIQYVNSVSEAGQCKLEVYQNEKVLKLELCGERISGQIKIYDLKGRLVKESNLKITSSINIEKLIKGTYIIVYGSDRVYRQKFIIE